VLWRTVLCCAVQELLEALKHAGDIEHYVAVLKREAAALDRVLGQLHPSEPLSPATSAAAAAASTSQQQPASLAPAIGSQQEAAAASEAAATAAGGSAVAAAEGSKQEGEEQHEQEEQQQRQQLQGAPEGPSAESVQLPVSSRASR
jgi:hypothetical protein